jgi:hypothetical protein
MADATYSFVSVLRRGLAALVRPGTPAGDARVGVPVSISAGGSPVPPPPLALRGPGDVAGFDAAAVRRTWPAAGAADAEPNYFALLELNDADLPWRYSPEPTNGDRLAPWLCLIIAEEGEIGERVAAAPGRPLPTVTVADAGALPDLTQAWAWAHAQILGAPDAPALDFDGASVHTLLEQAPTRVTARLLCPRQLRPHTGYHGFLVPTYERGRLAGLGDPTAGVDRLAPAWQPNHAPVTLPVYYTWSFRTGEAGDFASLVAKLHPAAEIPVEVWQRELAVSTPGTEPPRWQVVDLESALVPLGASVPDWSSIDEHGFTAALAARTNAAGNRLEPPLYGRWLAAVKALSSAPDATPRWFPQLNADPRTRIAAGLGTAVVQAEQQELLAGAWAQVEGIRAANDRLRFAQLARELALRLYTRHVGPLDAQAVLELSSPVHARVRVETTTVAERLAASPIADGALAPAWRRVARPLGTLGMRQARPAIPAEGTLARLNGGALTLAPVAPPSPTGSSRAAARLGDLGAVFAKANVQPEKLHTIHQPHDFAVTTIAVTGAAAGAGTHGHAIGGAIGGHGVATDGHAGAVTTHPPAAAAAFVDAAAALMARLAQPPTAGVTWVEADLGGSADAVKRTLDPIATIERPLAARLVGVRPGPRRTDPLEPVMAAPDFPQPMYRPLTRLAREWLLPGLDKMDEGVALFKTNWPFIESYLVGLNHELARKLLWNGYPTDQRGTYFRHFWDVRSRSGGDAEADIGPIHGWDAPLGQNRQLPTDPLVLVVRGALIRRYPNVVVYAAEAVKDADGRHPGDNEQQPIFFGRIEPDVALFGFDLDPEVVRGDPGWFFVLAEHPSEPRFGLAVPDRDFGEQPSSWKTLGWNHLAASADALAALHYVDLDDALPQAPVNPDPADVAWHASGTPPARAADIAAITIRQSKRLAMHGSMLVPKVHPHP